MVSDLVTTLRLLTDQSVHVAFTQRQSESVLQPGGGTSSSGRPRILGTKANLGPSMQKEIVDIWNRIRALAANTPIRLALRRWDIVSERFEETDALIDYWIALESLFVPGSTQELRYRASLRIAAFVGQTPEEREQVYKDLKDSYNLRSRIIHGNPPESRERLRPLIDKTRSYRRRALLSLLSSSDPFDPEEIETRLLKDNRQAASARST